jgi:hypothetical protein
MGVHISRHLEIRCDTIYIHTYCIRRRDDGWTANHVIHTAGGDRD